MLLNPTTMRLIFYKIALFNLGAHWKLTYEAFDFFYFIKLGSCFFQKITIEIGLIMSFRLVYSA